MGKGAKNSYKLVRQFVEKQIYLLQQLFMVAEYFRKLTSYLLDGWVCMDSAVANNVVQKADLIISLGSRFDDRTTGNLEKFAPKAFEAAKDKKGGIVHVNIEQNELNL